MFRASIAHLQEGTVVYMQHMVLSLSMKGSWWPVGTQLVWELTVRGRLLVGVLRHPPTTSPLGIYSIYSPRRSIHFALTFANHSKSIQNVVRPTRSQREEWPPRRKKSGNLSIVSSAQGKGGSPTGPDPENRVGDQNTGNPGRPVSSGLQVSGEPGHCRTRTRSPWWPSRGVFPSKCHSIAPAEMSNTPRW